MEKVLVLKRVMDRTPVSAVAAKMQINDHGFWPSTVPQPMNRDLQSRFTAVLLFLLTAAAIVLGWINLQKEREYQVPYDGVWWVEHAGTLTAKRVDADGPGFKAGIKIGDQVVSVSDHDVKSSADLERQIYRVGAWSKATYSLVRDSVPVDAVVILTPADKSQNTWLRLIALIYLGIGLYVLLRRWTAQGSTHFYIFCLVSFIVLRLQFTGKLNYIRLDDLLGQCRGVVCCSRRCSCILF